MSARFLSVVLLAVVGWLVWERQHADTIESVRLHKAEVRAQDLSDQLDAARVTLAKAEAELTRQRARLEAEHRAEQDRLKARIEDLRLSVAVAEVDCLSGRASEIVDGDLLTSLRGALGELREEFLASKARLAEAVASLAGAEQERGRLAEELSLIGAERVALQARLERVSDQRDQMHWAAFSARTVLDLCGPGQPGNGRRCAESVTTALDRSAAAWLACLAAGQGAPAVRMGDAGDRWPAPNVLLYQGRRESAWLLLCDPTLPEAGAKEDL